MIQLEFCENFDSKGKNVVTLASKYCCFTVVEGIKGFVAHVNTLGTYTSFVHS